jgi:hypothetical protein
MSKRSTSPIIAIEERLRQAMLKIDQHYRFTRVWAISTNGSLQIMAGHVGVVEN